MESSMPVTSHLTTEGGDFPVNSSDVVLPKEKKLIRCDLCGRTVNSESQAEAHFKGLYHLSRMQARGLPLPPDADLEKLGLYNLKVMKAMKSPVREPSVGPNFYNRRGPPAVFDMPGIGLPVTTIPPPTGITPSATLPPPAFVNSYTMNPTYNLAAHGRRVMCEICGVITNSPTQAQSHLNGRKHLTRLAGLGMPLSQDVAGDFLESSSMRHNKINYDVPKLTMHERFTHGLPHQFPTPRYQYSQAPGPRIYNYRSTNAAMNSPFHNGRGLGPRASNHSRSLIPCDTCQLLFNSQEQAEAHLNGSRHQKRLRMINFYRRNVEKAQIQSSTVPQIICPLYSTNVDSNKQIDALVQGKLHKSKLASKTMTLEENEGNRAPGNDSECNGDQPQQETIPIIMNCITYDPSNSIPGSSLNSHLCHQQHFMGSELEVNNETTAAAAAAAAAAAKQAI